MRHVFLGVGLVLLVGVSLAFGQASTAFTQPIEEFGIGIWEVAIPIVIAILGAGGLWLAVRAGPAGVFIGIVTFILLAFMTGAIPEIITLAGLAWPF